VLHARDAGPVVHGSGQRSGEWGAAAVSDNPEAGRAPSNDARPRSAGPTQIRGLRTGGRPLGARLDGWAGQVEAWSRSRLPASVEFINKASMCEAWSGTSHAWAPVRGPDPPPAVLCFSPGSPSAGLGGTVPRGRRRVAGTEEPNPSRPRLAGLLRQLGLPLREVWALTSSELPWAVPDD